MIVRQMGAGTAPALRPIFRSFGAIAMLGAAVAIAGSVLPWVTIFAGTETLTGWDGNPRYLAGIALAGAALTVLFFHAGRPIAVRRLATIAALVVVGGTAMDILSVKAVASSQSVTARLLDPSLGPGPFVMLAGGLALLAVVGIPASVTAVPAGLWLRMLLAGALFVTGWIHIALVPEHLAESMILGLGFLIAGVAQLALAAAISLRPSAVAYYAVVALNAALIVLYTIAAVKGLPFGIDHQHSGGLVVGSGEPIDLPGALSKAAELVGMALAFGLVGRPKS